MTATREHDDLYPRDEQHRFRLYCLTDCAACDGTGKNDENRCPYCRGEGKERHVLAAAPDAEGLGVALVTLGREGELEECAVGVLDVLGEPGAKWILKPWLPSPRNVSDAGRTLATARRKEN